MNNFEDAQMRRAMIPRQRIEVPYGKGYGV